jgi:hypothetical protein
MELLPEEQEEILTFIDNCDADSMVTIRLEDDEDEQPRLYGCYALEYDEFRNYMNSGGTWNHIPAKKMCELLNLI